MESRNRKQQNIFTFFLFLAVIIVVYYTTITSESLIVSGDGLMYYLSKVFFVDGIHSGEFPLWNPYSSIGTPFLADIQQTVLSPFNILYFIFDTPLAYNIMHIIQLIIAGFFMYLLLHLVTEKYYVSVVIGFIFAFSTVLSGYRIEHTTIITTVAFFPVILYFLERYRRSTEIKWLAVCDMAMAIQFVSGFTQIVLYFDMVIFVYLLYILYDAKCGLRKSLALCLEWIGVYILLIGAQLLPTANLILQTGRNEMPWLSFSVLAYDFRILWMMLVPTIYKDIFNSFGEYCSSGIDIEIYIGIICMIYLVYAVLYCRKNRRVKVILGIMLGTFLYGMVPHIPLVGKLVYHIPILNSFRVCARSLPIFIFFAIFLTGIGMAHLYEKESISKLIKINLALLGIVSVVSFATYSLFTQNMLCDIDIEYTDKMFRGMLIAVALCIVNFLSLLIVAKKDKWISATLCVIGIISIADICRFSVVIDEKQTNMDILLDEGVSIETKKYIEEDTENGYRTFVAFEIPQDYYENSVLNIAKYARALNSQNNIYNSWLTFIDKKLDYWNIKETVYYPGFLSAIRENTELVSMLGVHYILDGGEHDIYSYEMDETAEREVVVYDKEVSLEQGGDIYAYALKGDWLKKDKIYLVTVSTVSEKPQLFYADFYNDEYDGLNCEFTKNVDGNYEAILTAPDDLDMDVYVRIIASADVEFVIDDIKIESVELTNRLPKLSESEDGVSIYRNDSAKQIINIPDKVIGIDSFGDNCEEAGLEKVDTISYVQGINGNMDLTQSNASVSCIEQKRNSVSATVSADTEIFVNHAQLAYPGWRAYVDGEQVKLYTVNNLIQGAVVPAGNHNVEFRYIPTDFIIGLIITLIGILIFRKFYTQVIIDS